MKEWSSAVLPLFLVLFATAVLAASPDADPARPAPAPSSHHGQFGHGDMQGGPGPGFKARNGVVSYLDLTPEQIGKMR